MAACPNCGNELSDRVSYCPGCRAPVAQMQSGAAPLFTSPALPQTPSPRKTKKRLPTGAIIAIIAGCVTIVIIVVLVVLLAVSMVDIFKKPVDVTNAYIRALSKDDMNTAWGYLSAGTKAEKGKATNESALPGLEKPIERWDTRSVQIKDHRAQIALDIGFKSGEEANVYVYLVKEAGEWRVSAAAETPFPGFEEHQGV